MEMICLIFDRIMISTPMISTQRDKRGTILYSTVLLISVNWNLADAQQTPNDSIEYFAHETKGKATICNIHNI